jgi:MinD-like ATPase involved in chromosome partitioning or flagellar assembly
VADLRKDQASGLRALFCRHPTQRVSVAGALAGVGATSIALGLAMEGARSGLRVTVIDEHQGLGSATARLGLTSRLDLLQAINRDTLLASIPLLSQHGVKVVPAARLALASKQFNRLQLEALDEALVELTRDTELLVVDCALEESQLSALARRTDRLAVVTAASGVSVTAAYALIKRHFTGNAPLPVGAVRPVHVGVSRVRSVSDARQAFASLNGVVSEHLGSALHWLGCLPAGYQRPNFVAAGDDALKIGRGLAEKLFVTREMEKKGMLLPQNDTQSGDPAGLPDGLSARVA